MVQIVSNRKPSGNEAPPFEFKVYSDPANKKVFGYLVPYCIIQSGSQTATWIKTPWGVPVKKAYELTVALAETHGVEAIWINDPQCLFPENERITP